MQPKSDIFRREVSFPVCTKIDSPRPPSPSDKPHENPWEFVHCWLYRSDFKVVRSECEHAYTYLLPRLVHRALLTWALASVSVMGTTLAAPTTATPDRPAFVVTAPWALEGTTVRKVMAHRPSGSHQSYRKRPLPTTFCGTAQDRTSHQERKAARADLGTLRDVQ